MSNVQLNRLLDALEGTAVPTLLFAVILAGLLSIFLKWLHYSLFRRGRKTE